MRDQSPDLAFMRDQGLPTGTCTENGAEPDVRMRDAERALGTKRAREVWILTCDFVSDARMVSGRQHL